MLIVRLYYIFSTVIFVNKFYTSIVSLISLNPTILFFCYEAVIGGGIGGTTAAYELTNLALKNDVDFEIDLYEPGKIGGRLATINVNGYEFESGGSIIHSNNMYLRKYVEKFSKYFYICLLKLTLLEIAPHASNDSLTSMSKL